MAVFMLYTATSALPSPLKSKSFTVVKPGEYKLDVKENPAPVLSPTAADPDVPEYNNRSALPSPLMSPDSTNVYPASSGTGENVNPPVPLPIPKNASPSVER